MTRIIFHLSRLYLLSSIRRQVHLATLFLAVVLFMLPAYVNAFSLGLDAFERVAKDFGLSLINLFALGMALLLGSTSIPQDLDSRAIYPILARPVSRWGYILAHYLALAAMLAGSLTFLGLVFTSALGLMTKSFDFSLVIPIYGTFLQACIVAAVCMLFSLRASPALAGTIGAAVFLIGNLSEAFIRFFLVEDRGSTLSLLLAKGLKALFPNLTLFVLKDPAVHQIALPAGYLLAVTYYALAWVALLLVLGKVLFERVDL